MAGSNASPGRARKCKRRGEGAVWKPREPRRTATVHRLHAVAKEPEREAAASPNGESYRDAACTLCVRVISLALGVDLATLMAPTRSQAEAAFARQIAMYLAHTSFGLLMTEVGIYFGRDRTTVAHAAKLVEDRRDEPGFDALLSEIEALLEQARTVLRTVGDER